MTFHEYIRKLNPSLHSEHSQEITAVPDSFIYTLIPAVEDYINTKAPLFQSRFGLSFVPEKEPEGTVCYLNNPEVRADYKFTFTRLDVLDYIYAVMLSRSFREKYTAIDGKEFPSVPFPRNSETFWKVVELGGKLRQIHLSESFIADSAAVSFPVKGPNQVEEVVFQHPKVEQPLPQDYSTGNLGAVYINQNQYFADVPEQAWELYLGGIKPAQKWLEDRKGDVLNDSDIRQFRRLILILTETVRLMQETDNIELE